MKGKRRISLKQKKKIALERIDTLFKQAKNVFKEDSKISDKHVQLARRIAMKNKVKIPAEFKRRICKNCHKYLVPGRNCRVRTHKGHLVYYCLNCKGFMRIGYK